DLGILSKDGFQDKVRTVWRTVESLRRTLDPKVALIGFAGSPWTVATYMVEGRGSKDYIAVKKMAYGDPGLFQRIIDMLIDASFDYLIGQVDAGAQVLQLFDSWAGVLPETEFERWVIAPTRTLVERLKAARPGVKIIGFPKGAGVLTEAYVERTGVDGVSLDS